MSTRAAVGLLLIGLAAMPSASRLGAATPAPPFSLESLSGGQVSLAQHRGAVVLINFWATWCVPCRTEMPWLVELHETFGRDLRILAVAMDEDGATSVSPFAKRFKLPFPVLLGTEAVADAYKVEALPATVLIDRSGVEVSRTDGPFVLDTMRRAIRALLPTPGTAASGDQP